MIKAVLPAWALAGLVAGCALSLPERPPVDRPGADAGAAHRPGVGVIESASVVSLSSPSPSASGGATASAVMSATMAYRVKMADGMTQNIVQAGERLAVGDRVEITQDGRLIRR